jgi:methionyl-tRNA formyltransferase
MFDTIILLTGPAEQPVLSAVLRRENPRLTVRAVATLAELQSIEPHVLRHARLIAFATTVVVPARILNTLGYGAYNFHPGPPHYPGRAPAHFAFYERATEFGATAHIMVERVDAGPIVDVELFAIPPDTTVMKLEELVYKRMARLFWRLAHDLATQAGPLPELPLRWSGQKSSVRLYADMCEIPAAISKDDLDRRIAAFGLGHLGCNPTVTLHGHRFRYVGPDTPATTDAPSIAPGYPVDEVAEYSI